MWMASTLPLGCIRRTDERTLLQDVVLRIAIQSRTRRSSRNWKKTKFRMSRSEVPRTKRVFRLQRRKPFGWGIRGPGIWTHLQRSSMADEDLRWGGSEPAEAPFGLQSDCNRLIQPSRHTMIPMAAMHSSAALPQRPPVLQRYNVRFSVNGETLECTPAMVDPEMVEKRRRLLAFRKKFVGEQSDVTRLSRFSVDGSNSTTSLPPGVRLEESLPFRISEGPWVLCRCCAYAYNRRNNPRPSAVKDDELARAHFVPGVTDKGTRRRSVWQARVKQAEYHEHLRRCCKENVSVPHEVCDHPEKGRIVRTCCDVAQGDFVCEYSGQLLSGPDGRRREDLYAAMGWGFFLFYFIHRDKEHCIDATAEREEYGIGRFLSHSRKDPNVKPEKIEIDGIPRLVLVARRPISRGEELRFDYGERHPDALEAFPWIKDT